MRLVVEGIEKLRKIVSVGLDNQRYVLGKGQELRTIPSWKGRRKSDCCWDEENQVITDEPYPEDLPGPTEIELLEKRITKLEEALYDRSGNGREVVERSDDEPLTTPY